MARYIKEFIINSDMQVVNTSINQYLLNEGYEYINFEGENVYKKGSGVMTNPSFFKFIYSGNKVRLETWMKYALLPGVYIGELGTTGMVGAAVKGKWKTRIQQLESILSNYANSSPQQPTGSVQSQSTVVDNNFYDENETQLLNENIDFDATVILEDEVKESKTVFCTSCGAKLSSTDLFCTACGQKTSVDTNQNSGAPVPPSGQPVSRKDFINLYAQPSFKKDIKSIAILCYVCAGITFIVSCAFNPFGIIDALALLGLALGMHLAKSRVCAILVFVLSIIEVILSLTVGMIPIWWLVAGIYALVVFNKIEKQYKEFLKR